MVSPECADMTCSLMRPTRAKKLNGYLLGSYRVATAPEPRSSRLTSPKSTHFDSPANNVGPWPTSLGCTTNSYSSINPSSANASGSFTPAENSPCNIVGATRRLLNFLSSASAAGDRGGGGKSKTASRPEFGTCDGTSSGNLVPKNYCPSPVG